MRTFIKSIGSGSLSLIVVTAALFLAALFLKGFSKDLLLEAAVFLVSAKLIVASYRANADARAILERLDDLKARLDLRSHPPRP
jgi:hypothetical protein